MGTHTKPMPTNISSRPSARPNQRRSHRKQGHLRPRANRGLSLVLYIFDAMAPLKFPIPICMAMPIPRLYWPERLPPSLGPRISMFQNVTMTVAKSWPCYHTRKGCIGTRNNEEGSKVFHTARCIGDVDAKPDEAHNTTNHDERRSYLVLIGIVG